VNVDYLVIDAIPSNHKHTEYKLEGDTLRRLRNVSNCSSEEFLTVIQNHVETRRKLLEQAMRQLA
jgi:hypothetical protein